MLRAAAFFDNFMGNTLQSAVNFGSGHDLAFFDDWHAVWDSSISGRDSGGAPGRTTEEQLVHNGVLEFRFSNGEKFQ